MPAETHFCFKILCTPCDPLANVVDNSKIISIATDLIEVGSLSWGRGQHSTDQVAKVSAVLDVYRRIPPLRYAAGKAVETADFSRGEVTPLRQRKKVN